MGDKEVNWPDFSDGQQMPQAEEITAEGMSQNKIEQTDEDTDPQTLLERIKNMDTKDYVALGVAVGAVALGVIAAVDIKKKHAKLRTPEGSVLSISSDERAVPGVVSIVEVFKPDGKLSKFAVGLPVSSDAFKKLRSEKDLFAMDAEGTVYPQKGEDKQYSNKLLKAAGLLTGAVSSLKSKKAEQKPEA